MAQRPEKRKRRRKNTPRVTPTRNDDRRRNLKRIVVALAIVVGLAGILVVASPGTDDQPAGRAPVG